MQTASQPVVKLRTIPRKITLDYVASRLGTTKPELLKHYGNKDCRFIMWDPEKKIHVVFEDDIEDFGAWLKARAPGPVTQVFKDSTRYYTFLELSAELKVTPWRIKGLFHSDAWPKVNQRRRSRKGAHGQPAWEFHQDVIPLLEDILTTPLSVVEAGKRGGKKGGFARAEKLSPQASAARWNREEWLNLRQIEDELRVRKGCLYALRATRFWPQVQEEKSGRHGAIYPRAAVRLIEEALLAWRAKQPRSRKPSLRPRLADIKVPQSLTSGQDSVEKIALYLIRNGHESAGLWYLKNPL